MCLENWYAERLERLTWKYGYVTTELRHTTNKVSKAELKEIEKRADASYNEYLNERSKSK